MSARPQSAKPLREDDFCRVRTSVALYTASSRRYNYSVVCLSLLPRLALSSCCCMVLTTPLRALAIITDSCNPSLLFQIAPPLSLISLFRSSSCPDPPPLSLAEECPLSSDYPPVLRLWDSYQISTYRCRLELQSNVPCSSFLSGVCK